jgi:DNA-binding phage protein
LFRDCYTNVETFLKQKKLLINFFSTIMATALQKTGDPRQAYIIDKVQEMNIRFPVADIEDKTGIGKSQISKTLAGKVPVSDYFFETFCKAYKLDGVIVPFLADDDLNWERAAIKALTHELAKAMSKIAELTGGKRDVKECLQDIEQSTTLILSDLRRSGKKK